MIYLYVSIYSNSINVSVDVYPMLMLFEARSGTART